MYIKALFWRYLHAGNLVLVKAVNAELFREPDQPVEGLEQEFSQVLDLVIRNASSLPLFRTPHIILVLPSLIQHAFPQRPETGLFVVLI